MGDEETSTQAEKLLTDVQLSGFHDAQIIIASKRHRICIATFDNKREAEEYLNLVKAKHPQYNGATLLSVRNIRL